MWECCEVTSVCLFGALASVASRTGSAEPKYKTDKDFGISMD